MITSLYTADVKLNKTDKDYKKYLIAINENGVLIMDKGLFVVSFFNEKDFKEAVEMNDNSLKYIGDITL